MNVPSPPPRTAALAHAAATAQTVPALAAVLRLLRRREARDRGGAPLAYRDLAARTGWSHAIIGEYLTGTALPPTDRFDQLVRLLGATSTEIEPLAAARDRVEELRRPARVTTDSPAPVARVPRELPPPVAGFVGRSGQLAELDRIAASAPAAAALPIAAICGDRGTGKTALALRWAHARSADFPDGQLYLDLHGTGPRPPVTAADALARLLRALAVPAASRSAGVDELTARYRTTLADRRVLVVLDNAMSAEHVRPLLPGSPTCMVVVTSQNHLAGLIATDGAHRIALGPLAEVESVELLQTLLGTHVYDHESVAMLARVCGRQPAALRNAAERLQQSGVHRAPTH
jgi:hypothetical protein